MGGGYGGGTLVRIGKPTDVLDIRVSSGLSTACICSENQSNYFYLSQTGLWVAHACSECTGVLYPIGSAIDGEYADA